MSVDDDFAAVLRNRIAAAKAAFAETEARMTALVSERSRLANLRDLLSQTLDAVTKTAILTPVKVRPVVPEPTVPEPSALPPPGRQVGLSTAALIERDSLRTGLEAPTTLEDALRWGQRNGAPTPTGDWMADLRAVNAIRKQASLPAFTVAPPKKKSA